MNFSSITLHAESGDAMGLNEKKNITQEKTLIHYFLDSDKYKNVLHKWRQNARGHQALL